MNLLLIIVDDQASFEFSPKAEFALPFQQSLEKNHRNSHSCYSIKKHVETLSIQMALKPDIA